MNTNELLMIVKRKRSPVVLADSPKPLAVGDVCPHCGQVVADGPAEKNPEPLKPESEIAPGVLDVPPIAPGDPLVLADGHQDKPVEVSKPKKSRANAPKN